VLTLAAIPLMDGAAALADTGLCSTLWQANREGAGPVLGANGPRGALLFDPQTCGGLLAAVSGDQAETLLSDLRKAGYPAAIIGHLTSGAPTIICR
jgi:selenide, water dikinase